MCANAPAAKISVGPHPDHMNLSILLCLITDRALAVLEAADLYSGTKAHPLHHAVHRPAHSWFPYKNQSTFA
jgi:hypothetical protein